jgi:hypothetical protein
MVVGVGQHLEDDATLVGHLQAGGDALMFELVHPFRLVGRA